MGTELQTNDYMEIVAEANRQLVGKIDNIFINIVGCDSECTVELLSNSRNNLEKILGRNRLSLKRWCSENDYNHKCVYDILKDSNIGLGWIETLPDSQSFKLTPKGIKEIYGDYTYTRTPIMTIIGGSVYIDETHENFNPFIKHITDHKMFEKCGGYNEDLKSRKMMFSKNELSIAKELGINLGIKGDINGKTEND